jgi:hypothetical protein
MKTVLKGTLAAGLVLFGTASAEEVEWRPARKAVHAGWTAPPLVEKGVAKPPATAPVPLSSLVFPSALAARAEVLPASTQVAAPGVGEHVVEVPHTPTFLPDPEEAAKKAVGDEKKAPAKPEPAPKPREEVQKDPPMPALPVPTPVPPPLPAPALVPPLGPSCALCPPEPHMPVVAAPKVKDMHFGSPPITVAHDGHFHFERHDGAGTCERGYLRAEYLLWGMNDYRIPALATTGRGILSGFLDQPGTRVLFGPGDADVGTHSGGRFAAGIWLDDCGSCGVEASLFFLGRESFEFDANSRQFPRIVRPFFAPNLNAEFGETVVSPGLSTGGISIRGGSELWGADVNFRRSCLRWCDGRAEVFVGFRYLELSEDLEIVEDLGAGPDAPRPVGTRVLVTDRFTTRNEFYGGQIGGYVERAWGPWYAGLRGSVALGSTHQSVDIRGSQIVAPPGQAPQFFSGGLLATGPNLGRFSRDAFSVVPELNLNVGYRFTPHWRVFAGYGFLYWNNVVRPGDQIDRVIDLALVPNPPPGVRPTGLFRPAPTFRTDDLWAHGLNLGVEYLW